VGVVAAEGGTIAGGGGHSGAARARCAVDGGQAGFGEGPSSLKNGGVPRLAAVVPRTKLGCTVGGVAILVHSKEALVVFKAGGGAGVPC
jgi:hypothetical protein